ncbi:hypothetical protein Ciccas_007979 [Cichlidogyrus casuarinus]|uniref:Uncharacterized protein n=1 Tax=Cichlidogyrus casuarinus TaxID=1844966 RepID=A0ABD2Q1Q7_9PLAT
MSQRQTRTSTECPFYGFSAILSSNTLPQAIDLIKYAMSLSEADTPREDIGPLIASQLKTIWQKVNVPLLGDKAIETQVINILKEAVRMMIVPRLKRKLVNATYVAKPGKNAGVPTEQDYSFLIDQATVRKQFIGSETLEGQEEYQQSQRSCARALSRSKKQKAQATASTSNTESVRFSSHLRSETKPRTFNYRQLIQQMIRFDYSPRGMASIFKGIVDDNGPVVNIAMAANYSTLRYHLNKERQQAIQENLQLNSAHA